MTILFISIGQIPFLAPTLNNADLLFALVITPGFYPHHVEVADQDPASGKKVLKETLHKTIVLFLPNYSSACR